MALSAEIILTKVYEAVLHIYNTLDRDICLQEVIEKIVGIYRCNMGEANSPRVDFLTPSTRWAYMYMYIARHAYLVYKALSRLSEEVRRQILSDDDNQQMESVCAIGGGPATDIIGLTMVFRELGIATPFAKEAHVLDRSEHWNESWELLLQSIPNEVRQCIPNVRYHPFDFKNQLTDTQKGIIQGARIVTMIKSLSPVAAYLDPLDDECSLYEILKCVSPGNFVLYIDNKEGSHNTLLLDAAKVLKYDTIIDVLMTDGEDDLPRAILTSTLREETGYTPCISGGVNRFILLKKQN